MPLSEFDSLFPTLCRRLRQAKLKNRRGQAYLLLGDNMDFLERFALAWAQTAACQSPKDDGSPCGHCEACRSFQNHAYPELYVVRPTSKSRAIKVEDMREFEHVIGLSPRQGFLKVGMLVEAERLNDAAQNAFLKTLEEPPPDTMLLLLTVNARMLLPTIKSRCQTLALLRNSQDYSEVGKCGLFQHLSLLRRQAGAAAAIRASAGISAILAAQHSLAEETVKANHDATWDDVEDPAIQKRLAEEQLARIEAEYMKRRTMVTSAMQAWFLQRLMLAAGADKALLPNPEMYQGLQMPTAQPDEAAQDIQSMEDFLLCLQGNVDEKLALDALCLAIAEKTTVDNRK